MALFCRSLALNTVFADLSAPCLPHSNAASSTSSRCPPLHHETPVPLSDVADVATVEITLISHTNAGKTTLARKCSGRDMVKCGPPHVTEIAEAHTLLQSAAGDVLRYGIRRALGDSARLVQRLRLADNPIGWLLREIWDRYSDRPFWCSQQAVRAARESSDVVLYLVNAAEDPRDAGYVAFEAQVLIWVGKPVVVLLNQIGPPRPAEEERAESAARECAS